jgi:galactokinase
MVEIAQSLPDCYGARLTGAGFGGRTVKLVESKPIEELVTRLSMGYEIRTCIRPEIYTCRTSIGADVT